MKVICSHAGDPRCPIPGCHHSYEHEKGAYDSLGSACEEGDCTYHTEAGPVEMKVKCQRVRLTESCSAT